jgi:hypothetical protein
MLGSLEQGTTALKAEFSGIKLSGINLEKLAFMLRAFKVIFYHMGGSGF